MKNIIGTLHGNHGGKQYINYFSCRLGKFVKMSYHALKCHYGNQKRTPENFNIDSENLASDVWASFLKVAIFKS